jgi:hypothetical protein
MGNSPLVFLGGQSYRRDCGRQQGLPVGRRPLLPLTLHPTGQDMIRSGDHVYVDRGFCTRHGIDTNNRHRCAVRNRIHCQAGPAPRPPAVSPPTPDPAASTPAWEDHPRPADTPTATTPSAPGLFIGVQGAGPGLSKSVWIPLRSRSLFDIAVYPCLVRGGEPVMDPQPVGVGPGIGCRIVQGERDP